MAKYISFLRGINVGGHKIIKMENLKNFFEAYGLKDVKTYIQSGNVIFQSPEKDIDKLNSGIEKHLFQTLGFAVEVFTRSEEQLKKVHSANPFVDITPDKTTKIYVSFLRSVPPAEKMNDFESLSYDAEKFVVLGTEAYILLYKDRIKTKAVFANNILEKKLGVAATTRDWNTINKILEL
jgi:uncharacterized protein (DUF1697 family)